MSNTPLHSWAHPITVAFLPAYRDKLLDSSSVNLLEWFRANGSVVQDRPTNETDLIITTARHNQPVAREAALLFHAKRQYGLSRRPQVLTMVSIRDDEYAEQLQHFTELAASQEAALTDRYKGLGPQAVEVLLQQAQRGGPEVALGRLLQAQAISIRVMAIIGDQAGNPLRAVHFDLAGAHPTTDATDPAAFAQEVGRRILSAICAHDVDHHDLLDETLPRSVWERLTSPEAMINAGSTFAQYGFFTTPISIEKILGYRGGLGEAIAAQYSEGCYAVYEPNIPGLITTATGSSRLVDKRSISRDDQAIVVGVKPERDGAKVIQVEGRQRVIPSVEAVEMMGICEALPQYERANERGQAVNVPAVRAILHGHVAVAAFDPARTEVVNLDEPFYDYLVSCGTGALASATAKAFQRAQTMKDPSDPRKLIFLEQPGHGVVILEKWVEGKGPFETIRDYLEKGLIRMTMEVPQGRIRWEERPTSNGRRVLEKPEAMGAAAPVTPV
jgi:hypothetical protein